MKLHCHHTQRYYYKAINSKFEGIEEIIRIEKESFKVQNKKILSKTGSILIDTFIS